MADLKIAIVVGSTRQNRNSAQVAAWVAEQASGRTGADYEVVDLRDFHLPLFEAPASPAYVPPTDPQVQQWAAKVDGFDGFVFVTPEYNHSVTGVLKNALDVTYTEWTNKAAAFAGFGSLGGARAVEHLRGILSELQIAHVRTTLAFSLFTDFESMSTFTPGPQHADSAVAMFDQLESWSAALKTVRTGQLQSA